MLEVGTKQKRITIPYFEGVNSLVSFNLAKKTELSHAENARSRTIGSIEKREGQTVLGTAAAGAQFRTRENFGIFSFQNSANKGIYRISLNYDPSVSRSPSASYSPSASGSPSSSKSPSASASPSVSPSASGSDSSSSSVSPSASVSPSSSSSASGSPSVSPSASASSSSSLSVSPSASISPSSSVSISASSSVSPSASSSPSSSPSSGTPTATIYYLNNSDVWTALTGEGTSIYVQPGGVFDYTYAEGNVFLANQEDQNRYIKSDGTTVVDATDATGHLYNCPPASVINYYKNRLYVSDFIRDGSRHKNTVLRSSKPMGIISLINADYASAASGATINLTSTDYFYTTAGANVYDVYRGTTLIKQITVTTVNQTSIVATWSGGAVDFLSGDEVWIQGTYAGEDVFRWAANPAGTGVDVREYDTFKLSGGENEETTMMENIGDVMMIANKKAMATWNDSVLQNFDLEVGCVSKSAYVKSMGAIYFMDYNGIYSTTGSTPQLISNKVERYISGATKAGKEACAAGKKGRSVFFCIGDVTLYNPDGSTQKVLKNVCLEFNIVQQSWFVHTNVNARQFATYVEATDSDRLVLVDNGGVCSAKEFLNGLTDDGDEIHFRIDTNKLTLQTDTFEMSSRAIALMVETERGTSLQTFINLENGEGYYPIEGKATKGLSILRINGKDDARSAPPETRMVSISLRDSSPQRCKINRMVLVTQPGTNEDLDNLQDQNGSL